MKKHSKASFKYFLIIWNLAWYRNIARYTRTHLGSLWIGLTNLLQVTVFAFVYGVVFKVPSFKEFFIYLGFGITIWTFMAGSVSSFSQLLMGERNRLLNFSGSLYDILAEEYLFHVQVFFQALAMLLCLLFFIDKSILLNSFVSLIPLFVALLGVFWISIAVAILSTWIKDFAQVIPVIINLLFLTSPIMYPKEALGDLDFIPKFNILYFYLDPLRDSFIEGKVNIFGTLDTLGVTLILLFISLKILIKNKFKIIDFVSE